jgi:hypothetical protein
MGQPEPAHERRQRRRPERTVHRSRRRSPRELPVAVARRPRRGVRATGRRAGSRAASRHSINRNWCDCRSCWEPDPPSPARTIPGRSTRVRTLARSSPGVQCSQLHADRHPPGRWPGPFVGHPAARHRCAPRRAGARRLRTGLRGALRALPHRSAAVLHALPRADHQPQPRGPNRPSPNLRPRRSTTSTPNRRRRPGHPNPLRLTTSPRQGTGPARKPDRAGVSRGWAGRTPGGWSRYEAPRRRW